MGDYLAIIQKTHTVYDITTSKQYTWGDYGGDYNSRYVLINKLKGVKQVITKQQAQTLEQQTQEYGDWNTIDDTQARELAIQLGLAS